MSTNNRKLTITRAATDDQDFQKLVKMLDHELWVELQEDQATYDQFNFVPDIKTAIIIYSDQEPVAIGCFKKWDDHTIEIKRMFVQKAYRGRGISKLVLNELEKWAGEMGFKHALLETSIHFKTARKLYETNGYYLIPNYPPYTDLEESVCMRKDLD